MEKQLNGEACCPPLLLHSLDGDFYACRGAWLHPTLFPSHLEASGDILGRSDWNKDTIPSLRRLPQITGAGWRSEAQISTPCCTELHLFSPQHSDEELPPSSPETAPTKKTMINKATCCPTTMSYERCVCWGQGTQRGGTNMNLQDMPFSSNWDLWPLFLVLLKHNARKQKRRFVILRQLHTKAHCCIIRHFPH